MSPQVSFVNSSSSNNNYNYRRLLMKSKSYLYKFPQTQRATFKLWLHSVYWYCHLHERYIWKLDWKSINNQLEKLEAAKAPSGSIFTDITGPYWAVLGCTGLYWSVLSLYITVWAKLAAKLGKASMIYLSIADYPHQNWYLLQFSCKHPIFQATQWKF